MKITDKMRLDWFSKGYHTIRVDGYWAVIKFAETEREVGRGANIREAIDAAIRAEKRRKP